jgi:hypothetical protein
MNDQPRKPMMFGRWVALAVFSFAALVLFAGNVVCLVEFIHSGRFTVKSPEAPETVHFDAGAVALLAVGFAMAALCLVCAVCLFRERGRQ